LKINLLEVLHASIENCWACGKHTKNH
jgi:hypothetical protein